MQRVVNFYEKLPRGPSPEPKATGILGRYQAKHFGKKPSVKRTLIPADGGTMATITLICGPMTDNVLAVIHAIAFLLVVGYAQNYYFHLRKFPFVPYTLCICSNRYIEGHHKNNAH
jgi:hypothetical protein